MTLAVAAVVLIGGTISIFLILSQVNDQVKSRLEAARDSTLALVTAEQENLLKFNQLVSVRPTLCSLLQQGSKGDLDTYLEELKVNSDADYLIVIDSDQQVYSSSVFSFDLPQQFYQEHSSSIMDIAVLDNPLNLVLYSISNVVPQANCASSVTGQVISIEFLDDDFLNQLASDTGLELSLIIKGHYAASSLPWGYWMEDPVQQEPASTIQSRRMCTDPPPCYEEFYYIEQTALLDSVGEKTAFLETAFPAGAIRRQTYIMIAILAATVLMVAAASVLISLLFTKRISSSLTTLSGAAERMGAGDLDTPVPVASGWISIDQLANQLENSRRNLQQIQKITRRGLIRFVHLMGAIREGMLTIDAKGVITWVSQDACRILGYNYSDLVRKDVKAIFRSAPGETSNIDEILRNVKEKEVPSTLMILNANDGTVYLNITSSRLEINEEEPNKETSERVIIFREISEEEAFNRLQSEFLANVAHEFRTPLATISAATELLCDEGGSMSHEELDQLMQSSRIGILHLQTLVDNLLEKATIEAGVFRLHIQVLNINENLSNVSNLMAPQLERRKQQLIINTVGDFSNFSGDPVRIVQALVNLVQNASKFSKDDSEIHLDVTSEGDRIRFSVSDSGEGLPTDRYEQLFDRFFTGDRSRGSQYGIGLGLQIVKSIAEAHGGTVGAENLSGGGARVWFTIPARIRTGKGGKT